MSDIKSIERKEEKWYHFWEEKGYFKADPTSAKPPYSLLIPPPNLTGDPHMGHAMQHVILDAVARVKRLQGYDVLLLPGVDHAGIQFEGTLNKRLEKEGLSKFKMTREEWMEKAWAFKDEVYTSFHNTWTVFGLSADWKREVFTLDPKVSQGVLTEFKTFWEQELLYKGAYIVQWCSKCGTAIEDIEMEYQERKDKLYYLQYGPLVIATTRPETKFGDTAMAVNPTDERYKDLVGKEFDVQMLTGIKKMIVIADEAIDPAFGTGAEKVTPAHDMLDYEIGKRHNLPLIQVIGKDGRLTEVAGKYAGMKIQEAREAMLPEMKEMGILLKEEEYTHSVPVCERCKTVVEPIISEEWFVKMKPLAEKSLARMDEITFIPENYKQILSRWMEEIHDWSISRSLWWGHRIPVWYCTACNLRKVVGKEEGMSISLEKPMSACVKCGKNDWVQDEQVLDTWFSSGLWPLVTLGWPEKTTELKRYYPWGFEITAPEIKYLWIARMIMLGVWFNDDIPFKNMFFHGTLRDLKGVKMSKSLGNGVDPIELINQWGTDAVRMTLYSYASPGRDPRASRQTMDERCKNFRNFATKLRNIHRFIYELKPENGSTELVFTHPDDVEIKEALDLTIKEVSQNIESFNLHLATETLYNFLWHTFADSYVEKSKTRRSESQAVLEHVFSTSLILLHPFMPFLTEELYQTLPLHDESIMISSWPK